MTALNFSLSAFRSLGSRMIQVMYTWSAGSHTGRKHFLPRWPHSNRGRSRGALAYSVHLWWWQSAYLTSKEPDDHILCWKCKLNLLVSQILWPPDNDEKWACISYIWASSIHFYMFKGIIHIQLTFWQSCWWDFMGIIYDIIRRYNHTAHSLIFWLLQFPPFLFLEFNLSFRSRDVF